MDYNNLFSGDYWTPEGYRRRKEAEREAAQKLAVEQDKSNRAPWEALGGFLGDSAKNVGDWIGSLGNSNPNAGRGIHPMPGHVAPQTPSFQPNMERTNSSNPSNSLGPFGGNHENFDTDFMGILNGKYNTPEARTPDPNFVLANPNFHPEEEDELNAKEILERLGEKFSFDRGSVDTSPLDSVLQNNLKQLNGVRDTTNQNFQKSDQNINSMYSAHQKDVQGQTPAIQQRGEQNVKAVGGIFDKTIQNNNAQLAKERQVEAEMLQRLGIAPAANQPDLYGQAIAEGNNQAAASRDQRQAEARTNAQTDVSRNSTLASAVGNDGLQRRSDLNMRLQEILGGLGEKEVDYQNDYQQNKMELLQRAEDQSYDRWLQDRQFDMGLFNSVNDANAAATQGQADRDHELEIAHIRAGGKANDSGSSQGWLSEASPEFQNAFFDVAQKVDIDANPQKAIDMLADPKYGLNPAEVVTKIKDYTNLGRVTPINQLG